MIGETFVARVENSQIESMVKKNFKMSPFERVTAIIIALFLIVLMSMSIHTRNIVSEKNTAIENTEIAIAEMKVDNQILQQKIDDMMTYERISDIAQQYGLSRQIDNVKTVSK